MAAREQRKIHDVEWTQKIAPFITRKTAFRQQICELVWTLECKFIFGLRPLMSTFFPQPRMQFPGAPLALLSFPEFSCVGGVLLIDECNTSITTSHKSRAGIPSIRKLASSEKSSDSVEP